MGTIRLMAHFADARWYVVRRATNTKPATYTCPLCGRFLPALTEHALVLPDGDPRRRRHAHTACVVKARRAGRLAAARRGPAAPPEPARPLLRRA